MLGRLIAGFKIPAMAVAGIAMLVLSCGDGTVEPPPPPAPVATLVTVNPGSAALSVFGETVRFTAEVRDQYGQVMAGAAVAWASDDTTVATVDASGVVTAVGNGSATITATAGSVSGTAAVTVAQVLNEADRAALVALYEATDGPNWLDNTNWLSDAPLGEWYGVKTDASGRVVEIDLSGYWDDDNRQYIGHGLIGTIPPELANLADLEILKLEINGLTGTIPPVLGSLANLKELDLSRNSLRGVIPPELGGLANLTALDLGLNLLRDRIPPALGGLVNLEWLRLEENQLTGPIPQELRALAGLRELDVGWNSLSGPIPSWLGELTELGRLSLRVNDFTGSIPRELGNLTELWLLLLDGKRPDGPDSPGTRPTEERGVAVPVRQRSDGSDTAGTGKYW